MANIVLTEGSGTLNQLIGNIQVPLASYIDSTAQSFERASVGLQIFTKRKSTNFAEGYGGATGIDDFSAVGENGNYPTTGFADRALKTLQNTTWKQSIKISREALDDAHGNFERIIKQGGALSRSYYRTIDRFLGRLLGSALNHDAEFIYGGQGFNTTSYDGKQVFSADHPGPNHSSDAEDVQSNLSHDEFSVDVLEELVTRMQNFTDDSGNLLGLNPDTIIIPNIESIKRKVFAAVGSDKLPGTSFNDMNYIAGNFHVLVWPELNFAAIDDRIPFAILDSTFNAEADCCVFQEREELSITDKWEDNDAYWLKGRGRFTGGFVDWRGICAGGVAL